jgi:hypothetical protein
MADSPTGPQRVPSALPPVGARVIAFVAILAAGICGGLIGYAFADLQCTGDCTVVSGLTAVGGAAFGAGGVAVVVVLILRAMGEWKTIQARESADADKQPRPGR